MIRPAVRERRKFQLNGSLQAAYFLAKRLCAIADLTGDSVFESVYLEGCGVGNFYTLDQST